MLHLQRYVGRLLGPLRGDVVNSPFLLEIPKNLLYFSLPPICGPIDRAFTRHLHPRQPSLIPGCLLADVNIKCPDVRTGGNHIRQVARVKYGFTGSEVAMYFGANDPTTVVSGTQEYLNCRVDPNVYIKRVWAGRTPISCLPLSGP